MKMQNIAKAIPVLFLLSTFFWGCEAEIDEFTPHGGDLNLESYVAVGNSLTAGFADGELYRTGQEFSFPNIIASQLGHAGLQHDFRQPLMADELGFGQRLILANVDGSPMPVPMPGTPDPANFENIYDTKGPFHNMGVPGALTAHLLAPGYGTMNPYFERFASDPQTTSVIADALHLQPTFFTLWIGNNDILGFVRGGGEGPGITPPGEFAQFYQAIVQQLTADQAKGAVANIPEITAIPFLTFVTYDFLVLDAGQAAELTAGYAALGAVHITFEEGRNPLVVFDDDHPAGIRQMEEGELVLLSALNGIMAQGWGSTEPLGQQHYLTIAQKEATDAAVAQYNDIIRDIAAEHGLAHVDIHSELQKAETGTYFDAIPFSTEFISGGVFSLDGIHLTPRGNAIVANVFIGEINGRYNAGIPKVAIGNFPGIVFP